jgi:hypothetical protein
MTNDATETESAGPTRRGPTRRAPARGDLAREVSTRGASIRRVPAWTARLRAISYVQALAAITAAGAILRLATLARQPIGLDEDFTAVAVHSSLGRMIDIVAHDSAPPLFYLAAKPFAVLAAALAPGGAWDAAALRAVPAVAGIALIPLLAALGRRIGGDRAGLWTAAFAAFLPSTVLLSEFARMYGPAAALTVAAALLMWRAVERPSAGRWTAYVLVGAAAVWTDYFAAVALAGIFLAALSLRPGRRVAAVAFAATGIAVASIGPWLLVAQSQFGHAGQAFWIPPLGPGMIGGTVAQLMMGPEANGDWPFGPALIALQSLAVVVGFGALTAFLVTWRRIGPERQRAAVFCVAAASGVLMLAAVSVWRPILDARYATVMWLPLLALCGAGLAALPKRAAVLAVLVVAVPTLALGAVTTHVETSSLVPALDAAIAAGAGHDLVDASESHYLTILDECDAAVRSRLHVLTPVDPPWFVGTAAYPADAVIHSIPADVIANGGRIFWIADPAEAPSLLPAGYRVVARQCVIGACLTTYAPAGPA